MFWSVALILSVIYGTMACQYFDESFRKVSELQCFEKYSFIETAVSLVTRLRIHRYRSHKRSAHHSDLIMGAMASQPTGVSIVYLIVCSGVDQRKYQSFASLAFVRGIRQLPMNFPHKGRVTRNMFPFDDVTMHFLNTCSVTDFYRQVLRKLECIKATCAILHYNNYIGSALEVLQFCAKPSILSNYIMMSWHRNAFSIAGPHDDVIKWKHFPRYWTFGRGIHWSPRDSPHKSQWRELYVFFDLRPNKRLSKQFWGWWFETPSRPLWCHCNAILCFQARDV